MDELFFGKKTKPKRGRPKSPRRAAPKKTQTKSPRRKPVKCNSKMTLPHLRKLAMQNGVNVYSEAKTAISKRTGLPKKPKMVGCSTLMKRLNDAGLSHLYRIRDVRVLPQEEYPLDMVDVLTPPPQPVIMPDFQMSEDLGIEQVEPLFLDVDSLPKTKEEKKKLQRVLQADPACDSEFKKFLKANPGMKKMYKGYAVGDEPCSQREFVLVNPDVSDQELSDFAEEAGFDINNYGRRHLRSGARPKKTQKLVGNIVVKGRLHNIFRGKEGGLYYLKGKSGSKIYIDKKRLKKN